MNTATTPTVTYKRYAHAAHYQVAPFSDGRNGHDIEEWSYAQAERLPKPDGIPANAEWKVGWFQGGVHLWSYTRIAPMTPAYCPHCPPTVLQQKTAPIVQDPAYEGGWR